MGDGRAEGSSAIGGGGRAAISLMPDVRIFESSQLEGSYVGDLLYNVMSWNLSLYQGGTTIMPHLMGVGTGAPSSE